MKNSEHIIEGVLIDDPQMSAKDRRTIIVLHKSESAELWDRHISCDGRHFMLLPNDSWPAKLIRSTTVRYYWTNDWNTNNVAPMAEILGSMRAPENEVLVFWGREIGVRTTNGVFARRWLNFLYEDEGVLVVSPSDETKCILSNGRLWIAELGAQHNVQWIGGILRDL